MKTKKAIAALAGMIALGLCCRQAFAQDDNTVRAGIYSVFYHTQADDVSGPFTPSGLNATR